MHLVSLLSHLVLLIILALEVSSTPTSGTVFKRQTSGSILACTGPSLSGTCTTVAVSIPACQSLAVIAPTLDDIIISAVPLSSRSLACVAWQNGDCTGTSVSFTFGGPQNIGQIVSGISAFKCSIIPAPF